jgi:hypothetical protein
MNHHPLKGIRIDITSLNYLGVLTKLRNIIRAEKENATILEKKNKKLCQTKEFHIGGSKEVGCGKNKIGWF